MNKGKAKVAAVDRTGLYFMVNLHYVIVYLQQKWSKSWFTGDQQSEE